MSNQPYNEPENNINSPVRRRRSDRHARPAQPRRAEYVEDMQEVPPPSAYSRVAQPQEDNLYPPQQGQYPYGYDAYGQSPYDEEEYAPRRWPWVVFGLVLALALAFAAIQMLVPDNATGVLGSARKVTSTVVDSAKGLLGIAKPALPELIKFESRLGAQCAKRYLPHRIRPSKVYASWMKGNVITGSPT